jgi:hypothetical protein
MAARCKEEGRGPAQVLGVSAVAGYWVCETMLFCAMPFAEKEERSVMPCARAEGGRGFTSGARGLRDGDSVRMGVCRIVRAGGGVHPSLVRDCALASIGRGGGRFWVYPHLSSSPRLRLEYAVVSDTFYGVGLGVRRRAFVCGCTGRWTFLLCISGAICGAFGAFLRVADARPYSGLCVCYRARGHHPCARRRSLSARTRIFIRIPGFLWDAVRRCRAFTRCPLGGLRGYSWGN